MTNMTLNRLFSLPLDLMETLLKYLSITDKFLFSETCKQARDIFCNHMLSILERRTLRGNVYSPPGGCLWTLVKKHGCSVFRFFLQNSHASSTVRLAIREIITLKPNNFFQGINDGDSHCININMALADYRPLFAAEYDRGFLQFYSKCDAIRVNFFSSKKKPYKKLIKS